MHIQFCTRFIHIPKGKKLGTLFNQIAIASWERAIIVFYFGVASTHLDNK